MTSRAPAQCLYCARWSGGDGGPERECEAYPKGILGAIWANVADHRKPQPNDHGKVWQPLTKGVEFPAWVLATTVEPAAKAQRSARDSDDDDWDEDVEALIVALAELADDEEQRAFDPVKHPRNPKGAPGGGRFRSIVDQLKDAIADFKGGGDKHPLEKFNRDQLMRAAKARGIPLKRGEDRDSIAAKLLADLNKPQGGHASAPAAAGAKPAPMKVTTAPGLDWPNGDTTTRVSGNGDHLGIVVRDKTTGGYFPFLDAAAKDTPLGNRVHIQPGVNNGYQTEQSAVDAIVRAHTPRKVTGPGLAGLNLIELRISSTTPWPGSAYRSRASYEIHQNGTPVGSVHQFGPQDWEARDAQNKGIRITQGMYVKSDFKNKSEALQALVSQAGTPTAPKAPAAPTLPKNGPHGPEIQGALDIIFGKDPKGHTMGRQLEVYGSLRRHQFDQLGPAEQQTVIADLVHISATSKGKGAADAVKLVNRFTPAGTTTGSFSTPSAQAVGPANGTQTRLPQPQAGLIKQAKNSGVRGDTWMSPASGNGPKVWGKYGSGGLLIRHVDDKGEERFLMTQRGPGISDPGKWSYPGGAFESLEDFYQGSTREVAEELGFTDADFAAAKVHGYHVFERPDIAAVDGQTGKTKPWTYHSVAVDVPTRLKPKLSTAGAKAETSDAKWMTRAEIDQLDKKGKLHGPVAGGKLQQNVMSLYQPPKSTPSTVHAAGKRPPRLSGTPTVNPPKIKTHKPSTGRNLVADQAARDKLRQDVKKARTLYAGKVADDRLAAIGAMQGFDDVPTVVTKREFDDLLATGDYIQVYRGVKGAGSGYSGPTRGGTVTQSKTAAQIHEEFRSGSVYYGKGIYGNGFYFSTDRSIAAGYGDHSKGAVLTALIPKSANVVDHRAIEREAQTNSSRYSKARGQSHEQATLWDEGRYAAAKGHDMIKIPPGHSSTAHGKPNYVVLNRSVMIVLEEQ